MALWPADSPQLLLFYTGPVNGCLLCCPLLRLLSEVLKMKDFLCFSIDERENIFALTILIVVGIVPWAGLQVFFLFVIVQSSCGLQFNPKVSYFLCTSVDSKKRSFTLHPKIMFLLWIAQMTIKAPFNFFLSEMYEMLYILVLRNK